MKIVNLSSKNQITLPVDMLTQINANSVKKLLIQTEMGKIVIKPLNTSIVAQTAGSLTKLVSIDKRGLPLSEIMTKTQKIVAKKLTRS